MYKTITVIIAIALVAGFAANLPAADKAKAPVTCSPKTDPS
jgi:hypothetical protein